MDLPPAFVDRLQAELGRDVARAVLATMRGAKDVAYWVNPLRTGEVPEAGQAVAGVPGTFAAAAACREALARHPAATTGRIYLLNPSSAVAVQALDAQPGEAVLDLAAAPGGKTVLTAACMHNAGAILAVDAIKTRFFRLRANLERCGVANASCRLDDGRNLGRRMPAAFDRVLLDAPCSSEARFRAGDGGTFRHWSPRKVRETAHKQRGLIRAAFACLKPGGTLLYCTCSFARKENEGVVGYLLRREPTASIVPLDLEELPQVSAGTIDGTVRIMPDRLFDGFYVAKLTKRLGRDVVD